MEVIPWRVLTAPMGRERTLEPMVAQVDAGKVGKRKYLPKYFLAILLLYVTSGSWAACPAGTEPTYYLIYAPQGKSVNSEPCSSTVLCKILGRVKVV